MIGLHLQNLKDAARTELYSIPEREEESHRPEAEAAYLYDITELLEAIYRTEESYKQYYGRKTHEGGRQ